MSDPKLPPRILIVYAHPRHEQSHVNRGLCDAAASLPNVTLHDLYETYPDFHIDTVREQAALEQCNLIVLQHPIQWYGMPSLLKEWIDVVFEHGWAYGHEGRALAGKDLWLVTTTGAAAEAYRVDGYHGRPFSDFMAPYEQTARLCGMRWRLPFIVHGARDASAAIIETHAERYRTMLASYPLWDAEKPDGGDRHVE